MSSKLVRVFSDLHLEFGNFAVKKCIDICKSNPTKYTILAGDITNFSKKESIFIDFINELKLYTNKIIYILGNHEYYDLGHTKSTDVIDIYKKLSDTLNIYFLENNHLETDDFIFYGATLWSNVDENAYYRMNDKFSFNNISDIIDRHIYAKNNLENFINNYKSEKSLVVITHHMPSFKLIDPVYRKYGTFNSGFASELDYLIKNPVSYWIYGHTHKPNDTTINGVRLLCNPHGYPKELYSVNKYPDCTF